MSYEFVTREEWQKAHTLCLPILNETCTLLKQKNISAQSVLIGSGAQNMVTRNGNGPYDLDYNLVISKAPDEYWKNPHRLKDLVRITLDRVMTEQAQRGQLRGFSLSPASDSTSCLAVGVSPCIPWDPQPAFHLDVGILWHDPDGAHYRLKHIKNRSAPDDFVWNKVKSSRDLQKKITALKKDPVLWQDVRDRYLALKNHYLSRREEEDHPSYSVFIEAVNQAYHAHFGNHRN